MNENFKCGFIAIIGKPNVGKSTLMNLLLGEKLSIATPKPQTTRQQIKGILSDEKRQIILLDTPGFVKPRYMLHEKMVQYIKDSLKGADLIIFMTDAHKYPTDYDHLVMEFLNKITIPKLAILNKIDLVNQKTTLDKIEQLKTFNFEEVLPLSLHNLDGPETLLEKFSHYLPYSPPLYDPDQISDLPVRFFVQEIIREQLYLNYKEEIPYATTVVVEIFKEHENKVEISANIWVERKSQKPIILGSKGQKIKEMRLAAEKEIYKILSKRIKLDLWVKVKPNWRNKKNALNEFGYH